MSSDPLFPGTRELIAPAYQFLIENLISHKIVAEYSFSNVSYNNIISDIGKFQGKVALTPEVMLQSPWTTLSPGINGIWVLRNNSPVWAGIIDSVDYDENSNVASVTAFTYEYWYTMRNQTRDINVKNMDQFDIARLYVNTNNSSSVMNIEVDSRMSGVKRERNAYAYELNTIDDELSRLASLENGFDYRIIPYRDQETSELKKKLTFGYPVITTNTESNTTFIFESNRNVTNVSLSMSLADSAVRVYGIGEGEGTSQKVAIADDTELLAKGYPRYEASISAKNVKEYSTLVSHVHRELQSARLPQTEIKLTARGSDDPYIGSFAPGDWLRLRLDNQWFGNKSNGVFDDTFRVTDIKVTVTDRSQETVDLTFTGHGVSDKLSIRDSSIDVYVPPTDGA